MATQQNEQPLRRLSVELQIFEETAQALQARINMVRAALTDLSYANIALEGLEQETENTPLLVPIGGNSYIKASLQHASTVIVGMGAGVSFEKTVPEAKEIIRTRTENLEKTQRSLQQQFSQVAQKITEYREKLRNLVAELREGTPPTNV